MEIALILLAAIVMFIAGVVWTSGGAGRASKKLIGQTVERAKPLDVGKRRWLIRVTVTGVDAEVMRDAMRAVSHSPDPLGALVARELERIVFTETVWSEEALGAAIASEISAPLMRQGLRLGEVDALGYVALDEQASRRLQRYDATACFHRDHNVGIRCNALDLYLDGVTGRGDYSVEMAHGEGGALVRRPRSVDLVANMGHIFETTREGSSALEFRSFTQMIADE